MGGLAPAVHALEASAVASAWLLLLPSASGAPALLHVPSCSPGPDSDPDSDPELDPGSADPAARPSLSSSLLLSASLPSLPPEWPCARGAPAAAAAPADVVEPGLDPAQELVLLAELAGGVAEVASVDAPPVPLRCAVLAAAPCMAAEDIRHDQCTSGLQARRHRHWGISRFCAAPEVRQPHAAMCLGRAGRLSRRPPGCALPGCAPATCTAVISFQPRVFTAIFELIAQGVEVGSTGFRSTGFGRWVGKGKG